VRRLLGKNLSFLDPFSGKNSAGTKAFRASRAPHLLQSNVHASRPDLPRGDGLKLVNLQQLAIGAHHNCESLSRSRTVENVETAIATFHLYILECIVFYSGLSPFAGYRAAPGQVGFPIKRRAFGAAAFLTLIDVACAMPHSFFLRVRQPRLHETFGCYYSGKECQTPPDTQRRPHQQFNYDRSEELSCWPQCHLSAFGTYLNPSAEMS
jgi:hypothetical protein